MIFFILKLEKYFQRVNIFIVILLVLTKLFCVEITLVNSVSADHIIFSSKEKYYCNVHDVVVNFFNNIKSNRLQIISNYIAKRSTDEKIIFFNQPEITIFNKKNIPIWKISCNQAKLIEKNILNLYGYVFISKILNNRCTESIIAKQVVVNIKDGSIISKHKTIIHGFCFYSVSSGMYVNLNKQIIKLFGKIYTQYEIK